MSTSKRKLQTLVDIRDINELFAKGKHKQIFPLRVHYFSASETKTLFSVSKKKLPRAVDRNKIKRILKDLYFKKYSEPKDKQKYHLGFVYLSSKLISHQEISKCMEGLMNKINQ
jgi:ribonuclease P protein component